MKQIIYDGKDVILGRLGTRVAKDLLKGNTVAVINAEAVVISGSKEYVAEKIKKKRKMGQGGSLKGPKYIRQTDRLLKRMIRGMLPWDKPKGREAYKRLKCYNGNGDFKEDELKDAKVYKEKLPFKYTTMKDVVGALK